MVDSSGALVLCGTAPTTVCAVDMDEVDDPYMNMNQDQEHQGDKDYGGDMYDDGDNYAEYDESPTTHAAHQAHQAHQSPPKPVKTLKKIVHKDMFALLDPHLVVPGSRAVRRGKTYKIPTVLQKSQPVSMVDYLYADAPSDHTAVLLRTGKVPNKGLFDSSLLCVLQMKRKAVRAAKMAAVRQQEAMRNISTEEEAIQYQNLSGAHAHESRVEELWAEDYADYDDGGDMAGDMGDGDVGYEAHEAAEDVNFEHVSGLDCALQGEQGGAGEGQGEFDWARLTEEEELARRVQSVLNEDLHHSSRTSYESICQKYIDNFNKGAHHYAKETHLSRRVSDWTQRLEPILAMQEEAGEFDIHAYCATFIGHVDDVVSLREGGLGEDAEEEEVEAVQEVGFSDVANGRSSAEVCRVFLACLQLTNAGNVSIIPTQRDQWNAEIQLKESRRSSVGVGSESVVAVVDPFKIRLLSNIHSSGMENFRAPSLCVPLKSALKKGKGKGKRVQMGAMGAMEGAMPMAMPILSI
jgi:hypothetical protein